MMKDNSPQVAQEADRLERALAAAGLDSESPLSYPYWAVTCSRVIYNVIEIFHKLHAPTTCARVRNGGMLYLIDRRCVALQQQKKPL